MTAFDIKLIAIVTMVIDHIGLFFFPNVLELRMIGRLAFPLFAWLIANGAYHTHNIKIYLVRLLALALISQVPFSLANHYRDSSYVGLNVLFTLCLGLIAIIIIKKIKYKLVWIFGVLLCALTASFLNTDYGAMGVFSIVAFYIFFNNTKHLLLSQFIIYVIPYFDALQQLYWPGLIELLGLFSLIFIYFYNKKEGPKTKYLFYIFYPIQYVVIYLLQTVLT